VICKNFRATSFDQVHKVANCSNCTRNTNPSSGTVPGDWCKNFAGKKGREKRVREKRVREKRVPKTIDRRPKTPRKII